MQLSEATHTSFSSSVAPASMRRVASQMSQMSAPQDEDTIDFREVDKVLTEAAGIAGRWGLFRKFLFDRLRVRYSSMVREVV